MTATASPSPRIAIVGAGPAGCMLARLLHLGGVEAVVFEGEASPNYRSQGGTLDLHTDTGLAAVREAGLWDEFAKHARYDGEYMLVADPQLRPLFAKGTRPTSETTFGGQRPEIDRADLRRLLAESLPADAIRWGHHVRSVGADGTIAFDDAPAEAGFDLVVGADGAWSKVRRALSDTAPVFSGVAAVQLEMADPQRAAPELHAAVHRGSLFAQGEHRRLVAQQMGDGSLSISVTFRAPAADWPATCGFDPADLVDVQRALLGRDDLFAGWHPTLRDAIAKANGSCAPRLLHMLPVGFTWPHRRRLTLVGDAAHLMTPFAGEGVNVALDDARRLAAAILAAAAAEPAAQPGRDLADALDDAVAAFEKEMFARTVKVTRLTEALTQAHFFADGTPQSIIARTTAMHACFYMPALLHPPMALSIHALFLIKKLLGSKEGVVIS